MRPRTVTSTVVAGVAFLGLIATVGWFALIGPVLGDISTTSQERTDAQDRNAVMSNQLSGLRRQVEELPDVRARARALSSVFPPTADQPEFFREVTAAGLAAGLRADDITGVTLSVPAMTAPPAAATAPTDISAGDQAPSQAVQQVSVNVTGSYKQLVRLLRGLELMPRALLVDVVSLSGSDDNLSLTITGTAFVAPPIGSPPPAPS